MRVNAINNVKVGNFNNLIKSNNKKSEVSFKDFLLKSIDTVDGLEKESQHLDQMVATGQSDDFVGAIVAAKKSEMALTFSVEVKNRVMDAYKEIMRMQI